MLILLPIIIYLCVMLGVAWKVNEIKHRDDVNFMEEYFIGSRNMGGFVLAMTIIATYIGASSFIGGPGVAYKLGLGWVLLACIQTPTAFLTLGILGKRLAIISRKIGGVTITDLLRARYKNDIVVILGSVIMLIFFIGTIVANFVGGARLFESVTGLPYIVGLIIFSFVIITYTTIGGFRAVALTDAIQGCVMLIASGILFFTILKTGGGMENIMRTIQQTNPQMLTPDSGGAIAKPFILSFWMLVGVAILGLPATTVRCMGFKNSKSMHNAMIIGTSVVGVLMLIMHLIGVMGLAISPGITVGDKIIPSLAINNLHPILAGVFIGGPLAAIMSTVDSFLILSSATIVKDLYINYINPNPDDNKVKKISLFTSLFIGLIVFFLSLNPPELLVWINLFALAGQESAFFCPIILGLYWKRANAVGAISSMIFGVASYIYFSVFKINFSGMHQIVPVIFMSIIVFVIGSYLGEKPDDETIDTFFNI
ncbi:sodium/panthothenate symporter [Cetobacterium sp. 8H]|uniref:sodium/pantothenate symporter n=1 Tax=Cetobacterium sp. 8H TaxID=2759681 RepID=UPI00163C5523|nr:sodium/pantothenate symporter [Cetobacterium sp. 8H]MBC2850421.1 sodium/panthothenate symporter [Cetobacterium sp. 8H]